MSFRHLTYPENGELCDSKEGGNPRHDVAKPGGFHWVSQGEYEERNSDLNLLIDKKVLESVDE